MSLLKWLKKIFEIKPVQPKVKPVETATETPKIDKVETRVEAGPTLDVLKEGMSVVDTPTILVADPVASDKAKKPRKPRKPRKSKDYNG
jgi:hypothetical protein